MIKSIAILTSHYKYAVKQTNIHSIDRVLRNLGYDVDWYTYPVSISLFRTCNRYKRSAWLKGVGKQSYLYVIIPRFLLKSSVLRLFSFVLNPLVSMRKKEYDVLLTEGVRSSYAYKYFNYKKLIVRMSDDINYLRIFSDEDVMLSEMAKNATQIWATHKITSDRYDRAIYLPNPSLYDNVDSNSNRLNEVVYAGSNKFDNILLYKIAESGVKVNLFTERQTVFHDNIIFHGLVKKNELVSKLSMYKIGIIPFYKDEYNKYMEMPLKTYDYIAAGLHVVMITSSKIIDQSVIDLADNYEEFIELLNRRMFEEVDVGKYSIFLKKNTISIFSNRVDGLIKEL